MTSIDDFWAVIPAGGSGTRLWPLSRRSSPKFLHDLTGTGQSLLRATWERLVPLVEDRVLVVTGAAHEDAVRGQLPMLRRDDVVAEPLPRDSMPAIGLAAAILERRDPGAILGAFHADHVISDLDAFRAAVAEAIAVARTGDLVTIGIEPTHPATGFGYIKLGDRLDVPGAPSAHRVDVFVEKPDAATAESYVRSGEYRWNAGMFVVGATTLLELLAETHPELAANLRIIASDPRRLHDLWPSLSKIAIDHAVAEPAAAAGRVAVVPASFGWNDIGDFSSLAEVLDQAHGTPTLRVITGVDDVVSIDSSGLVAADSGRAVAIVGLDDVIVIDTADALLVTTKERAQDVKKVVDELQQRGRSDLT
ncbi:mannose-1-phosphate guanylyltransferase [Intrasporangium sp.]|uniref:mannose-1-phosphate guanylyltransferase n=1 Tax=Intrasporangium sp. TaxID=1925024 RepID=UPI00293A7826|nr:mannose-1-phosphate guanylyltransferase [Intrasporangium sp.]MDV3223307.1 NTP transferase domain-containing protein [Intrasporangium sp.]